MNAWDSTYEFQAATTVTNPATNNGGTAGAGAAGGVSHILIVRRKSFTDNYCRLPQPQDRKVGIRMEVGIWRRLKRIAGFWTD